MTKKIFFFPILLLTFFPIFGQNLSLTFQEAEKQGIMITHLDSIYKSAVHTDTSKAVFKTDSAQQRMGQAYIQLLNDLGKFLTDNHFIWDKKTKCYNRIYFNTDGSIDYFIFNFLGKPEDKPLEDKQKEFTRLLNLFVKYYKILVTAKTKFAQCSPTTYMPQE